ncbi:MAG TPA: ABC transporter permease [Armatimonadota bacterium]
MRTRRPLALLQYRSLIVLLLMFVAASLLHPLFLTPGNLGQVLLQNSIVGILAVGMTFVVLTGGIDLSVGSVMLCSGVITAGLLREGHVGPVVAMFACIGIGAFLGLLNGIMIAGLRLPPFIATLAMMVGAISVGQLYSGGSPIIIGDKMPPFFQAFDAVIFAPPTTQRTDPHAFPGIPVAGLIFLAAAVIAWIVLTRMRYGRYVYALGGNEEATRLSGVNTRMVEASVYIISGMLAGVAALIYTARLQSGQALYGLNLELDAIAAAVIGGASLMGGVGNIGGTFIGVLFVGFLINVMGLRNVDPYAQGGIRALAIILGVLIQTRKKGS